MEMTMDMKIDAIKKMIEMRNQLITMQRNLGMWDGFEPFTAILILSQNEFFEIAKAVEAPVFGKKLKRNIKTGTQYNIELYFSFNGTDFHTFVNKYEYKKYRKEISGDL